MPQSRPIQHRVPQPHCPSCSAVLEDFARACPRCHFTAKACLKKFPYTAPRLERYLDAEGRLSEKQRRPLNRAIDRFEKVFPQTRVYVCVTRLPEDADCREFGYWLFNACQPVNEVDEQHRFRGILIVIDRENRAASITVGYGLDSILEDHTLFRILEDVSVDFKCGKYRHGLRKLLRGVETRLKASRQGWRPVEQRHSPRTAPSQSAPHNPSATPSATSPATPSAFAHEHP